MKMQLLIFLAVFSSALCLLNCADYSSAPSQTGIGPRYPKSNSIIPLAHNNTWHYAFSHYDTSGAALVQNETMSSSVKKVFGIIFPDSITNLSSGYYLDSTAYDAFYYAYAWQGYNDGMLLEYRDEGVAVNGMYYVGEFDGAHITLYAAPVLFLAYPLTDPARSGMEWTIRTDTAQDSAAAPHVTLVDTAALMYFPNRAGQNGMSVEFLSCYLYEEHIADSVAYHYYHEKYGLVAYQKYFNNRLIRSALLREFVPGRY
ncbi:MAG: hypothetical protein GF398_14565 [Chitinivibrionales bacterium]|nr:hypothetical protein [Chitinivibrionales bacterium]